MQQLVYVAAVMLDADDVFIARTADFPAAPLGADVEITDGQIVVPPSAAINGFFNCCDAERAAAAAARLRPTNAECLAVPPGVEPWREVPSTYIVCEQDRAIHPEMQRWMSSRAGEVVSYDTDHSPFISMNDRLVDDLDRLARRLTISAERWCPVRRSDSSHSAVATARSDAAPLRPTSVGAPRASWKPSGPT